MLLGLDEVPGGSGMKEALIMGYLVPDDEPDSAAGAAREVVKVLCWLRL